MLQGRVVLNYGAIDLFAVIGILYSVLVTFRASQSVIFMKSPVFFIRLSASTLAVKMYLMCRGPPDFYSYSN